MTSKRKDIDDVENGDNLNKKVKTETNDNGVKSMSKEWEYGSGRGKWKAYNMDQNKLISKALINGDNHVEIKTPKVCNILFERMVQRNVKTGWEVAVRCKEKETDKTYVWQWLDKNKHWQTYTDGLNRLLKAAVQHDLKTVSYKMDNKSFTVNIILNEQVENSNQHKTAVRYIAQEDIVEEEKPESKKNVQKRSEKSNKKSANVRTSPVKKEERESVKSVVFSGKSPVDDACPISDKVKVLCEGDLVWDAMLNQTNLKNNNNKYYLMQLLQDNMTNRYHVWFRWGRVGFGGQNNLQSFGGDLNGAKDVFKKKFLDKTKNDWEDKDVFEKVPGKYDLIIVDYNAKGEDVTDAAPLKKELPDSKLDERLQALIELICNVKNMEEVVKEMKYDTNKSPLGKLTKDQIKAGYQALKTIDHCVSKKDFGPKLVEACDAFYTRIPHCFGMRQPPLIRTKEDVKLKIQLLETLGDIEIAMKVLKEELDENPIDSHYKAINCELTPLDKSHADFKMIEQYVANTHAKTHNQYKITLDDVFTIDHAHNSKFIDYGNRMLLWHGSRLTNWIGILNEGLRIAPPEAPVTGYMFGKGVYFADMCSKSANYCYTTRRQNTGILILSEVSLGKTNDLLAADYDAANLPEGCHSVKGLGKIAPDPKDNFTMSDGTIVPMGKECETGVINPDGYTLNYNEYIVYDTKQIKMKYLLKCRFNYH